jgi:hypothetical protein
LKQKNIEMQEKYREERRKRKRFEQKVFDVPDELVEE